MPDPNVREDLSRFVVHLTREYDGKSPLSNLRSILASRRIKAHSVNCLYGPLLDKLGFTSVLKSEFKSTCFTEAPLTQIHRLADPTIDRQIKLAPFGLVFYQDFLLERKGGPATYLNAMYDTEVRDMLLRDFREAFKGATTYHRFSKRFPDADSRIRHYAMQNVRRPYHDFSWEREWRHVGDLNFEHDDIVAVICPQSFRLKKLAEKYKNRKLLAAWDSLAFIDVNGSVDDWVETLSRKIRCNAKKRAAKLKRATG